jgi:hypothetical protein
VDAADVPVLWDPAGPTPSDDAARALREWARSRGVSLRERDEPARGARGVDLAAAGLVEADLGRAREALVAEDVDTVERALARAEAGIRRHTELPQAHWLLGEVLRMWAQRHARLEPRRLALAHRLWQDAEAVAGPRAAGLGEIAAPAPPPRVTVDIRYVPMRGVDVLLDGRPLAGPGPVEIAVGPHLLAVVEGDPSWAAFVHVEGGGQDVAPPVGADSVCRNEDLARARIDGDRVVATSVACGSWIFASTSPASPSIRVAICERSACGPLLEWRARGHPALGAPQDLPRVRPWPAWATWTLVGVGLVTAGAVTIVSTGALESRPTEPRFVSGGADTR